MENKFTIKDMNLYYGSFHALKGVNLNLPANEVTAFIGPSGCGKSTLLRSLNRMNDLVEGWGYSAGQRRYLWFDGHQPAAETGGYGVSEGKPFSDEYL